MENVLKSERKLQLERARLSVLTCWAEQRGDLKAYYRYLGAFQAIDWVLGGGKVYCKGFPCDPTKPKKPL